MAAPVLIERDTLRGLRALCAASAAGHDPPDLKWCERSRLFHSGGHARACERCTSGSRSRSSESHKVWRLRLRSTWSGLLRWASRCVSH